MGATRLKHKKNPQSRCGVRFANSSVLFCSLVTIGFGAYALDFDQNIDNGTDTTGAPTTSDSQESTDTVQNETLGFGRDFLKPGMLTGSTSATTAGNPAFSPSANGSGRLENNGGTTAWFSTGGFRQRGRYQLIPGWTVTPGFELRETYTDNVTLKSKGATGTGIPGIDSDDDFVTELNPSVALFGDQRRLQFQLRYLAQSLIYAKNTDLTDVRHRLFSAAQAEILPQLFFFDGSTSITQQNIFSGGRGISSNFGPGSYLGGVGDNINVVGDRIDVLSYNLSPYFRTRLKNVATAELRYTYSDFSPMSQSEDGGSQFGGSSSRGYRGLIESGPLFARLRWRLGYDRRDTNFSNGTILGSRQGSSKTIFEKYFAQLEYFLVPRFSILGLVGYENNEFAQASQFTKPPRGVIWDVGGTWSPSNRTRLQATYGQRFYGDRYFFDFSHRMQHTLFSISYTEEPTLATLQGLQTINNTAGGSQTGVVQVSSTREGILNDPTGGVATLCNQSVYVRKLLSAATTYTGLRNDLTLQFFREERNYRNGSASGCPEADGATLATEQNLLGVTGIWTHSLTPDTALDTAVSWTDLGTNGGGQSLAFGAPGQVWNINLNLSHRLSQNLAAFVGFRHIDRSSDEPTQDYAENRVFGSLRLNY